MQAIAEKLLPEYGLESAKLQLLNHGFNTTFEIDSPKVGKFALRINTNSKKSKNEVQAEIQLLLALSQESEIDAPIPLPTLSGEYVSAIDHEELGTLYAVCNGWLEGDVVGSSPNDDQLFELGALMARLHRFTETWRPSNPAKLPLINKTLLNSSDNLSPNLGGHINPNLHKTVLALLEDCNQVFLELGKRFELKPLHADLHTYNLMWNRNRLSVFDFDDAGIGYEIQDFANTIYYLRKDKSREQNLFKGYASVRNVPQYTAEEFELLLVGRHLVLLNDLITLNTAEEIEFIPEFIEWTEMSLAHFKKTGIFILFGD